MEKFETEYGGAHFYAARVIYFNDRLTFTAFQCPSRNKETTKRNRVRTKFCFHIDSGMHSDFSTTKNKQDGRKARNRKKMNPETSKNNYIIPVHQIRLARWCFLLLVNVDSALLHNSMTSKPTSDNGPRKMARENKPENSKSSSGSSAKRRRLGTGSSYIAPPWFWDNLSKIKICRRALKEFDRRAKKTVVFPPPRTLDIKNEQLAKLQRFARQGGPNLIDLRGVSPVTASGKLPLISFSTPGPQHTIPSQISRIKR